MAKAIGQHFSQRQLLQFLILIKMQMSVPQSEGMTLSLLFPSAFPAPSPLIFTLFQRIFSYKTLVKLFDFSASWLRQKRQTK